MKKQTMKPGAPPQLSTARGQAKRVAGTKKPVSPKINGLTKNKGKSTSGTRSTPAVTAKPAGGTATRIK